MENSKLKQILYERLDELFAKLENTNAKQIELDKKTQRKKNRSNERSLENL